VNDGAAKQLTHGEADVRRLAFSSDSRRILFETEPSRAQIAAGLEQEGLSGFLFDRRFVPSNSRLPLIPADMRTDAISITSHEPSDALRAQRRIGLVDLANGGERAATGAEAVEFAALTAPARPLRFGQRAAVSPTGAVAWTDARNPTQQGE